MRGPHFLLLSSSQNGCNIHVHPRMPCSGDIDDSFMVSSIKFVETQPRIKPKNRLIIKTFLSFRERQSKLCGNRSCCSNGNHSAFRVYVGVSGDIILEKCRSVSIKICYRKLQPVWSSAATPLPAKNLRIYHIRPFLHQLWRRRIPYH